MSTLHVRALCGALVKIYAWIGSPVMERAAHRVTYQGQEFVAFEARPGDTPVSLVIGGKSLELRNRSSVPLALDVAYGEFLSERAGELAVDVYSAQPDLPGQMAMKAVAPRYWSIAECDGQLVFRVYHDRAETEVYETLVLSPNGAAARFYCHLGGPSAGRAPYIMPLGYPLDFLLYSRLFLPRRTVIMHGCALLFEGKAYVFSGAKSAGKSTTARLWLERGASILNEEQIVLRLLDDRVWVYGSPWYGETRHCLNSKAPVDAIFLIKHGKQNAARRITGGGGATGVLSKLFIATIFKEEMPTLMSVCSAIAGCVPIYEYPFVPDETAVDHVLSLT